MKARKLIIFVFHFNRGPYLLNQMRSIAEFMPDYPAVIVDDHSDDPESVEILNKLASKYEILKPPLRQEGDHHTGGLHSNMNMALEIAKERGYRYAIMTQDDMQFTRGLTSKDLNTIKRAFARPNASFVVSGGYHKTKRGKRFAHLSYRKEKEEGFRERDIAIAREVDPGQTVSYADTGIFNLELFTSQLGRLLTGETQNELELNSKNLRMAYLTTPFMFFLPLPISFRGKNRELRVRLYDWLSGAGVHPIALKPEYRNVEFNEIPYGEDVLECPSLPKVNYWSLRGGSANMKARGGWRKFLVRLFST